MKLSSTSLFLGLLASAPFFASAHLRHSGLTTESGTCQSNKDEGSCKASVDDNGSACVWCKCAAIPSECLTQDQASQVPPGVFDCDQSSPSQSFLSMMSIDQQELGDDFCDANGKAGYIDIPQSKYDKDGEDKHLFYWMFEKRGSDVTDTTIPFVVWLTGGPGCSSSLVSGTDAPHWITRDQQRRREQLDV